MCGGGGTHTYTPLHSHGLKDAEFRTWCQVTCQVECTNVGRRVECTNVGCRVECTNVGCRVEAQGLGAEVGWCRCRVRLVLHKAPRPPTKTQPYAYAPTPTPGMERLKAPAEAPSPGRLTHQHAGLTQQPAHRDRESRPGRGEAGWGRPGQGHATKGIGFSCSLTSGLRL